MTAATLTCDVMTSFGPSNTYFFPSGGLNLMRHAKKSTNRDFRITFKEVLEAENQAQEDEGAEEEAEKASDEESQVCEPSVAEHTLRQVCTTWLI